jgi:mono/diheme cytochrome c family protein/heme/copper-type cytochrome/quinol oxidase subunit 4
MSAPHGPAEHHEHSFGYYFAVIACLTIITLVELGPLFEWYNLPIAVLLVLSAVKFTIVVMLFMHLKDDSKVFSQIFFAPLIGAALMVIVLMSLAYNLVPSPRNDSLPVQERHWTDYSGPCSSWVRSHVSNRWYCTSPRIDPMRLAEYNPPVKVAAAKIDFSTMSPEQQKAELVKMGESLFNTNCSACHQANGLGVPGAFPPLAGSTFAKFQDPNEHVKIILGGLTGEIEVNGTKYNGAMASFAKLTDDEIAAIATYERNSWGNDLGVVLPDQVAALR